MRIEIERVNRYYPCGEDLLKATGVISLSEACEVLGISRRLYYKWKEQGMSERVYKKYFGDD